ncbi:5284_t:CDS:2 [Paraglomus brasilianum]|uniref:5284_t:CDS:1 n=1 Tax=Paraglomus brasilianum TaxID=144538 RepID=A0A9N8WHW4_9GLOM|nr:5284_t:CDS:2 [Paraglomus brasilianum]
MSLIKTAASSSSYQIKMKTQQLRSDASVQIMLHKQYGVCLSGILGMQCWRPATHTTYKELLDMAGITGIIYYIKIFSGPAPSIPVASIRTWSGGPSVDVHNDMDKLLKAMQISRTVSSAMQQKNNLNASRVMECSYISMKQQFIQCQHGESSLAQTNQVLGWK